MILFSPAGINMIDVAAWYGHGLAEKVLVSTPAT